MSTFDSINVVDGKHNTQLVWLPVLCSDGSHNGSKCVASWGLQVYRQTLKSHVLEIDTNHLHSKTTYLEELIKLSHMHVRPT